MYSMTTARSVSIRRNLLALLAATFLAPYGATAATVDWSTVGIRVAAREVITQEGPRTLPYVVAVQEQSPAFFAGVQPGDAVSFIRCGSWTWNYIDGSPVGGRHYRSHDSVGANDLPGITGEALNRCSPDLGVLLSVSTGPSDSRNVPEFFEFRTVTPGSGQWLDTPAQVAATIGVARADQSSTLAQLRTRAPAELRRSPCSFDVTDAYDLKAFPPIVQEMASASRATGSPEDTLFWRDVVAAYCSDERNGALPSFETAVLLMSKGTLKPCDYDSQRNYAAIELSYERRERTFSRDDYNYFLDLPYMFGRLIDDTQRACFYGAVRGALGKP